MTWTCQAWSAHIFSSLVQGLGTSPAGTVQDKRSNASENSGHKLCRITAPALSASCAALLSHATSCHALEAAELLGVSHIAQDTDLCSLCVGMFVASAERARVEHKKSFE